MNHENDTPMRVRWARLRFQVLSPLLGPVPEEPPGEGPGLFAKIQQLSQQRWYHPTTGEPTRFSAKTIERWYYQVRNEDDPLQVLERKVPKHTGTHPGVSAALAEAVEQQYREHPGWTYQLHHDNLVALAKETPALDPVPSYATVRRYMKGRGLFRQKRPKRCHEERFVPRETRSYEVEYVHGLWHLDFHQGSRAVLTSGGEWKKPQLLGILDDRSRLCCHLQWYLEETAEALVHGLSQAVQKRGLPRALLTDNGSAMVAAETTEGLERLGIVAHTTLPASPQQNGKQECFWGQVEGRLLAMLEGERSLTLTLLNTATQAWVEEEYHRKKHSEIGETPLDRYLRGPNVGRDSPSSDDLRRAFCMEVTRKQRRSDGTVTVEGVRFEVPSAYRTLIELHLRVARWDLSHVDLMDPRSGKHLATLLPLDKARRSNGARRVLPPCSQAQPPRPSTGMAPLLRSLMADYAATGLPPAYLPKPEGTPMEPNDPISENS